MTETARALQRVSAMLSVQRYEEALTALAPVLAAEPDNSRAWCLLTQAHTGAGRHDEAAAAASRAVALSPSDDWPHRLVSMTQLRLGNPAAALGAAIEARKLAPHQWQAYLCQAEAALATQVDFDLAARAAAIACRLAPNEPATHFVSGRIALARGDRKAALAHQERALALDPEHSGALNELGRISLRRPATARAARHFLQAARSAPRVSIYSHNLNVAIRHTVALMIYAASMAAVTVLWLAILTRLTRGQVLAGLTAVALLAPAFGAVLYRRMPPQARPLFRRRRITLALGVTYSALLAAVAITAIIPARALPGALLAPVALIFAARIATYVILRHEASKPPGQQPGT